MLPNSLRRVVLMAMIAFAVAACSSGARREPARYDFGVVSAPTLSEQRMDAVTRIDWQALSWLAGTEMHYRLMFDEPQRRRVFSESRWAAPPGELVAQALRAHSSSWPSVGRCRIVLRLEALEQRFNSATDSSLELALRVTLVPPRGDHREVATLWTLTEPVQSKGTPAAAGAAAAGRAVAQVGQRISNWLADVATPACVR